MTGHRLPPGHPVLAIGGVVKRFGHRTALAGLDLRLGEGEVFALLGPNGAWRAIPPIAHAPLPPTASPGDAAVPVFAPADRCHAAERQALLRLASLAVGASLPAALAARRLKRWPV